MPVLSHVEPTPNPNAFKFHSGEMLVERGTLSFQNATAAEKLPVAQALFELGNIDAVLIAEDFVSVSGTRAANWAKIRQTVEEHLPNFDKDAAQALADQQAAASAEARSSQSGNELFKKVEEIIDMYVRPALAGDGGGVELVGIDEKTVHIRYQGACGSCPTSTASTLSAIENLLHDKVDPELRLVPA